MLISSAFFLFPVVLIASLHKAGLPRNTTVQDELAVSLSGTQRRLEKSCSGPFCTPLGRVTDWDIMAWLDGVDADSNAADSS